MKFVIILSLCAVVAIASPHNGATDSKISENAIDGQREQEPSPLFDVRRDTRFLLFTRFNPTIGQQLRINDLDSILSSHYSQQRPTRFLIHGWQSDATSDINIITTGGYLRSYDVNVIVVDWGIGANNINYIASRSQVNNVGALVAEFLDFLGGHESIDFRRLSLIGHSLGAHIAGAAGKRVRSGRINTIIGLDPAGPLFDANSPVNRLASTDADYVEVIHTDTRSFGIGFPIGDVDFFPNGGSQMPGCLTQICDHNQVVPYFVESLNSGRLWGRQCTSMSDMDSNSCTGAGLAMGGEPSNFGSQINGIFRMPTNANSPFGVGQF